MNNFSRIVLSSGIVLGGVAAANAQASAYADGYASSTITAVSGPDLYATYYNYGVYGFGINIGNSGWSYYANVTPDGDYGGSTEGYTSASAAPVGVAEAYAVGYSELAVTNYGSVAESVTFSTEVSSYAVANNATITDVAEAEGLGVFEAFHYELYSFTYNGNTYYYDFPVLDAEAASESFVIGAYFSYASIFVGDTNYGFYDNYSYYPGVGGGYAYGTWYSTFTVSIAPGTTEYFETEGASISYASSVPSPAAAIPFAMGLVAAARRRKKA